MLSSASDLTDLPFPLEGCAMNQLTPSSSCGGSSFELPRNTPAAVRRWYETHVNEGVHRRLAFYRAIERAAAENEISDSVADRLESALRGASGRLDLSGPPAARFSS